MSELVAYLVGTRAGRLIRKDNGNLQFKYDEGYAGPPISHALPVQREAHPHALCRAVFGGLLLEGEARQTIARNFGLSAGNDYALLEELGGDCAGAITLIRAEVDLPINPEVRLLNEEMLAAIIDELPERPLGADPDAGTRLSLAGAQPKLPVVVDGDQMSLPVNAAAATTHIIKPQPARWKGLVDNEAFCMTLARNVELSVASVTKRQTLLGVPYLLVARYDRDPTVEPIRRLHQEDFCQALGHPSDRKYQDEGGPSVGSAVELLRDVSAVPAQDLPRFWRALVFNWLIGNCDAHAKNFSLLYDAAVPTLAPLYDLVSTTIYPTINRRLAMSIDGARTIDEIDAETWARLAREVGLGERFARRTTAEMVERTVAEAERLLSKPDHDNDTARLVADELRERALAARMQSRRLRPLPVRVEETPGRDPDRD